jgi:hypothetical protein
MITAVFASAALAFALAIVSSVPVVGQSASATALRAAFVYNFAKFTEWPADAMAPDSPIVFCVADDEEMADALEQLVKGHAVGRHTLTVRRVKVDNAVRSCHVLYASALDVRRTTELLGAVERAPVLTVGDYEPFARLGGVASFFVEDGKMRFAVNVDSAQRARLQFSSKLLILARIVRTPHAGSR